MSRAGTKTRVMVVEDDTFRRMGLCSFLRKGIPDMEVVAELRKAQGILGQVVWHRPNLVIVSMLAPGFDLATVTEKIARRELARVILLIDRKDRKWLSELRKTGLGCCITDVLPQDFAQLVRDTLATPSTYDVCVDRMKNKPL